MLMLYFQRFVNFGKKSTLPVAWQSVTPLSSRLAPTFQAVVSSPVVAQQAGPSLRLPSELSISSSSSRVKQQQQQQQGRLVQAPRLLGALKESQVEVNLLEEARFDQVL